MVLLNGCLVLACTRLDRVACCRAFRPRLRACSGPACIWRWLGLPLRAVPLSCRSSRWPGLPPFALAGTGRLLLLLLAIRLLLPGLAQPVYLICHALAALAGLAGLLLVPGAIIAPSFECHLALKVESIVEGFIIFPCGLGVGQTLPSHQHLLTVLPASADCSSFEYL
jgi:hypothetical protein